LRFTVDLFQDFHISPALLSGPKIMRFSVMISVKIPALLPILEIVNIPGLKQASSLLGTPVLNPCEL
jgi:hypothetical protein